MTKMPFADSLRTTSTLSSSPTLLGSTESNRVESVVIKQGGGYCLDVKGMLEDGTRYLRIESRTPSLRQPQSVLIDLRDVRGFVRAPITLFSSENGKVRVYPLKPMVTKPLKNLKQMLGLGARRTNLKFASGQSDYGVDCSQPQALVESYQAEAHEGGHRLYYPIDVHSSERLVQENVRALLDGLLSRARDNGQPGSLNLHLKEVLLALGCKLKGRFNQSGSVPPLLMEVLCREGIKLAKRGREPERWSKNPLTDGEIDSEQHKRAEHRAIQSVLKVLIDTLLEERLVPITCWSNTVGSCIFEQTFVVLESVLLFVKLGESPPYISENDYPAEVSLLHDFDDMSELDDGSVANGSDGESYANHSAWEVYDSDGGDESSDDSIGANSSPSTATLCS